MYLHIDPTEVPPAVAVRGPDDFTAFKVVVEVPEHAWIVPDVLTAWPAAVTTTSGGRIWPGCWYTPRARAGVMTPDGVRAVEVTSAAPHRD